MNRRQFLAANLPILAAYALVGRAFGTEAITPSLRPEVIAWLREVATACNGLKGYRLSQLAWQESMADLFERVSLADLLQGIDFEALTARLALPDDRAATIDPRLPDIEGLPRRQDCILRVFGMARGRAIVPHGHANMASAHLVARGQVHVRHYQRIEDQPEVLVLQPSIDRHARPGDATTVSDERDNVHWLVAESEAAYTLDFIVLHLDPSQNTHWFDFVDVRAAREDAQGRLHAPRLAFDEAIRRYGREA